MANQRILVTEAVQEQRIGCLQNLLRPILRPQDTVLICDGSGDMQPVHRVITGLGGQPIQPEDHRWQTMLKAAFFSRATVIVGAPLVILGLCKVARYTQTPLNIRHVILSGAPSEPWMLEGIRKGLDAQLWDGCGAASGNTQEQSWEEQLQQELLTWTSVLDCRARKTEMGLELELVVFPGERLPKLPTCAKRCVRQWRPKEDAPFFLMISPKIG